MSNLAIITKQQVQIRQALIVRSMPLGLHEADVDDWIKTNSLDELTYETANDLLDYLGVLPVTSFVASQCWQVWDYTYFMTARGTRTITAKIVLLLPSCPN